MNCAAEGNKMGWVASSPALAVDRDRLADLCRRHHIVRLSIFGSALRDDFRPDSDVDVLVEFRRGKAPGLAFFAIEEGLSALFDRRVDLATRGFLSRHFRDEVIATAQVLYDEA